MDSHRSLDLAERRHLYALAQRAVDRAIKASDKKSVLTCDVPKHSGTLFFGVAVSQKIWLEVDLSNATGSPVLAAADALDVRD
jgi:hypothetical protein